MSTGQINSTTKAGESAFETRDFYLACFLRCTGYDLIDLRAEGRPWTPHVTLARFKVPAAVAPEPDRISLDERPFDVGEIVLFRSHLKAGGALYEPLAGSSLGGRSDL